MMYAVFKGIPQDVRERAYRRFANGVPYTGAHRWVRVDPPYSRLAGGRLMCPIGACLAEMGHKFPTMVGAFDDLLVRGVPNGDWRNVARFINRWDYQRAGLVTLADLARAMGVKGGL
jgi:hypothetical protein